MTSPPPTELGNDRAIIDRLTLIVLVAMICALACGLAHGPEALTGSFATVAVGAAGALGARRSRLGGDPQPNPGTPPPYTGSTS